MRCKNKFCIYYRKERCTAEDVAINSVGMCEDCVYVEIDESELKIKRVDALEKMDRQYQRQVNYEKIKLPEIHELAQKIIEEQEKEGR